jgi:hypothetical protein
MSGVRELSTHPVIRSPPCKPGHLLCAVLWVCCEAAYGLAVYLREEWKRAGGRAVQDACIKVVCYQRLSKFDCDFKSAVQCTG